MKKIPTIFERDWDGDRSRVLDVPVAECAWMFAGEGVATRKYDGTSCLLRGGVLYKRLAIPEGRLKPRGFIEVAWEGEQGKKKLIGWVPVDPAAPEDRWHREALAGLGPLSLHDGTFELVGPKVQGNPEGFDDHFLIRHDQAERLDAREEVVEPGRAWEETRLMRTLDWVEAHTTGDGTWPWGGIWVGRRIFRGWSFHFASGVGGFAIGVPLPRWLPGFVRSFQTDGPRRFWRLERCPWWRESDLSVVVPLLPPGWPSGGRTRRLRRVR